MAYDLSQLRLEGIEVTQITDCQICQIPGEHGELLLTAYVEEDRFEEAESLQPLRLSIQGEVSRNLFCGVLTEMALEEEGEVLQIHIRAKAYTYLMDIQKKSRTFQNISMTYSEVLRQILSEYDGSDCIPAFADCPVGNLEVQYQETDWHFLKRLFSTIYVPLTGEIQIPAIRIYAGVPALEEDLQDCELKEMMLDFRRCAVLREMGYELSESDSMVCIMEIEKPCGIFTAFQYHGIFMIAAEIHAQIQRGFLKVTVSLMKKEGIAEIPQFPVNLVGLALEGNVLEVKGESVRMHFSIDDGDSSADRYWFPYSTPSSSPDGSGWYYMPETGDRLRVYFPTKYMKDVLAISAVSCYEGKGEPDRMSNPNTKYLRSASGQEMNMGAKGIYLASAGDAASLMVGNDGRIVVKGNQIEMTAEESIDVKDAVDISFHSVAGAVYKCLQGGSTELDQTGNLKISGTKLNID